MEYILKVGLAYLYGNIVNKDIIRTVLLKVLIDFIR